MFSAISGSGSLPPNWCQVMKIAVDWCPHELVLGKLEHFCH